MSIRWMRTAKIKKGQFMQAIGWGKETAAYAQKKFDTPEIQMFVDAVGDAGTIRWIVDYDDLASFEKVQNQMLTDSDYWKLVDKAFKDDLFIDGQTNDLLMKKV